MWYIIYVNHRYSYVECHYVLILTWSYNFALYYLQSKAVTFAASIKSITDMVLVIPSNFEEDLMKTCKGLTFLWTNYMDKTTKVKWVSYAPFPA